MSSTIPFHRPDLGPKELAYIQEALGNRKIVGDGPFTKKCHTWFEKELPVKKALLTHSCTAAMEMSAMLVGLKAGDEVILPSYTFSSTANAVVLRGAVPVFVDIRPDTLNLDESLIEAAITPKTRAIFVMHYAGVSCAMDRILELAQAKKLAVLEDAAQGVQASYKGKALGTLGDLGALSFHETKNIVSGEGGALLINDMKYADSAEVLREKGTNRSQFFRGQVDKYTWVEVGSSYLPSELVAAVLFAQLERATEITKTRLKVWNKYHEAFADLEKRELIRRPVIPPECTHNAHLYYLLTQSLEQRGRLIEFLKERGVSAPFHYVPLHSAPAGKKYGRVGSPMKYTNSLPDQLLRLPMYSELTEEARVIESVFDFFNKR